MPKRPKAVERSPSARRALRRRGARRRRATAPPASRAAPSRLGAAPRDVELPPAMGCHPKGEMPLTAKIEAAVHSSAAICGPRGLTLSPWSRSGDGLHGASGPPTQASSGGVPSAERPSLAMIGQSAFPEVWCSILSAPATAWIAGTCRAACVDRRNGRGDATRHCAGRRARDTVDRVQTARPPPRQARRRRAMD